MLEFFQEFWEFLKERKKWWLLPIILILALVAVLLFFAQTAPAVAPFVYPMF